MRSSRWLHVNTRFRGKKGLWRRAVKVFLHTGQVIVALSSFGVLKKHTWSTEHRQRIEYGGREVVLRKARGLGVLGGIRSSLVQGGWTWSSGKALCFYEVLEAEALTITSITDRPREEQESHALSRVLRAALASLKLMHSLSSFFEPETLMLMPGLSQQLLTLIFCRVTSQSWSPTSINSTSPMQERDDNDDGVIERVMWCKM